MSNLPPHGQEQVSHGFHKMVLISCMIRIGDSCMWAILPNYGATKMMCAGMPRHGASKNDAHRSL